MAVKHIADMILASRGESPPLAQNTLWLAPKLVVRFSSVRA